MAGTRMGETSPIRAAYIEAIKEADRNNLAPLVDLHRQYQQKGQ
jgi:hypothetical protein